MQNLCLKNIIPNPSLQPIAARWAAPAELFVRVTLIKATIMKKLLALLVLIGLFLISSVSAEPRFIDDGTEGATGTGELCINNQ